MAAALVRATLTGLTMLIETAFVALPPRLSTAIAVNVYDPAETRLVVARKGAVGVLVAMPVPTRNWTLVTEPSLSIAEARIVIVAGAEKTAPLTGLVMD